MSDYSNLGISLNPMNLIGDTADAIKDNAQTIFKWTLIGALGLGAAYIVIKDPRVIGRYIRLPVDIAKGAVNMAGTAVKVGADAIMVIPNAISRK